MRKTTYSGLLMFLFCFVLVGIAAAQGPEAEWRKSKHANKELAQEGTWANRKEAAGHCGRCHTEQGFRAWVPQLLKGDPTFIKKPDGKPVDEAFLNSLGMTKDKVNPINCDTCHTSAGLRVQNDVPMLPNGIPLKAVGKGALCMACHNTRNGRIAWDSPDPRIKYTQPHEAAQADVIMGKNVYFYNDTGDTASPHAVFTGDSCVTCHYSLSKGGHAFKAGECDACHGEKMKESFVQKGAEDLLKQLGALIQKKVMASKDKIACVTSWDEKTDKDTPNTPINGSQIKAVEIPMGIHGQISLTFVMQDGKKVMSQLGNVKDACGDKGKPVFATTDPVVRALWNYLLFWYDGSKGVHNPRFTRNVLIATIDAMSK
jgi:mono/diheme cytochrome c family protein